MRTPWVPLGEVLELELCPVAVDPARTYPSAGVLNRGRGLFDKGELAGADTSYTKLFRLRTDRIVYSKLFGWEGSIARVPEHFDGYFVSSEFPTFRVRDEVMEPRFLEQVLKTEHVTEQMVTSASGLGQRRQRVNVDAFLRLQIPLPPLPEQDRIAAHLRAVEQRERAGQPDPEYAVSILVNTWLERLPRVPLGDVVEVGPPPKRLAADTPIDFVPMEAVDAKTGAVEWPILRARGDLASGYRQFLPGDIIFARITPSMQNGKSAIYRGVHARVGYGSTEFHVLRPRDPRQVEWIWAVLRTTWFIEQAKASFTGTAGQQRVPASFLERVSFPLPAATALEPAIRQLLSFRDQTNRLQTVGRRRDELAQAILPAARNEIFNAMR